VKRFYRIIEDGKGCGGFLCPPGHPNHKYVVHEFATPRSRNPIGIMSLESIIDADSGATLTQRAQAARLLKSAPLVCSEAWVRSVYGYFRSMYSPDGVNRKVADAISDPANTRPVAHHLGVMMVTEYFPDHIPRLDLLTAVGGWSAGPCRYCGENVQYEARHDALTIVTRRLIPMEGWVQRDEPKCIGHGSPTGLHEREVPA
jgi:hypothetical protein